MNAHNRILSVHLHRTFGVAGAVTLATCALLALVGLLPAGRPHTALAQGIDAGTITHTTASDFAACVVPTSTAALTDTIVSSADGGELRLASYLEDYFDGDQVDATKWYTYSTDASAQRPIISGGIITFDNTAARSIGPIPVAGRYAEIRARFAISVGNGDIGFGRVNQPGAPPPTVPCPGGSDCDGANRLFISLADDNAIFANGRDGYQASGGPTSTLQSGLTFTEYHRYRIEWNSIETYYFVDDVLDPAATFTSATPSTYAPYVWLYTDHFSPPRPLEVDWVRVLYYPTQTGQYRSCALAGPLTDTNWTTLAWSAELPGGTGVAFETRSSTDGLNWSAWQAVGASGGAIQSPNGAYLQYRATLSTTDVNASPQIDSVSVSYDLNEPPVANAGGPYVAAEGTALSLDASGSNDPNNDVLQYAWDLDYTGSFDTDTTGVNPGVVFPNGPAAFTIALRVTDESGMTSLQTTTLGVSNVTPAASTTGPYTGDEGSAIALTGVFSDPGWIDTHIFAWDFGDGASSMLQSPGHTYADNGVYTAVFTTTDSDDAAGVASTTITVANVAPTVATSGPYADNEGSAIAFTGIFTDPGVLDTHTFLWSFGDGTTSTLQSPSHAYADNGLYTAVFTTTDKDGGAGVTSTVVSVANVAPVVATTGPYTGTVGNPIAFTGSFTDPGALDAHTFLWTFGDGMTSTLQSPTHVYTSSNIFTATFRTTDKDGGFGIVTTTVNVKYEIYMPAIMRNAAGATSLRQSFPTTLPAYSLDAVAHAAREAAERIRHIER